MQGILQNRPDDLYAYATPEEIASTGLTPEKWRAVFRDIVWPRIQKVTPLGRLEAITSGQQKSVGLVIHGFRLKDGTIKQLALDSTMTSEGPKTALLAKVLTFAWKLEDRKSVV